MPIVACKSAESTPWDVSTKANSDISFCKQTEENDPSEDFEEYLACAVCGDNGK